MDGSTLDLPDTAKNEATFGRPGASRGKSGFPQLRFVSLVENGKSRQKNPAMPSSDSGDRRYVNSIAANHEVTLHRYYRDVFRENRACQRPLRHRTYGINEADLASAYLTCSQISLPRLVILHMIF